MIEVLPLRSETLPPATTTNCVLVGRGEFWVVDPGSPFADEQERLRERIQARIDSGEAFAGVVLTHRHRDHVSGASAVASAFGCEVFAHATTQQELSGKVAVTRTLAEGDVLGPARIVFTPGHARGHICLWVEVERTAIVGDMVAAEGSILIAPPDGDVALYLASLERLMTLAPLKLVAAHGPLIEDGLGKLEHYVRHRRERERKVYEAVDTQATSLALVVERAYSDTPQAVWPLAQLAATAHLVHLEQQRRVTRAGNQWRRT